MLDYGAMVRRMASHYPGDKIGAIKLIREWTNTGLAEAKEIADQLWEYLEGSEEQALNLELEMWLKEEIEPRMPGAAAPAAGESRSQDWARELARFYPQQKIEAIKYVRERTGLGLKEAKDLVEQQWSRIQPAGGGAAVSGESIPDYEVRGGGFPWVWVALAAAAGAVAWYFTR
jgi:ribosomal protein L7/L12